MKLSHLVVGSALLACAGVAQAAVITVANGSFETYGAITGPGGGGDTWLSLPASGTGGWDYPPATPLDAAYLAPHPYGQYEIGTNAGVAHFTIAADGIRVLNTPAAKYGITQTLPYTVNAGDVFTLEFDVAKSLRGGNEGTLTASILVGASTIGTDATIATTLGAGLWDHKTVTGTAAGTGGLSIAFLPGAGSPWLDNVTMSVAVPEPASLGLLSLAGLALMRRRK